MISGVSGVSVFADLMRVLTGLTPTALSPSSLPPEPPILAQTPSPVPPRVDSLPSAIQRVEVPEPVLQAVKELELVNMTGALRSVGITAFNTLNSSIKRVHQGQ